MTACALADRGYRTRIASNSLRRTKDRAMLTTVYAERMIMRSRPGMCAASG